MCRSFDTNRKSNDVFFVSSIEIKPNIIDFEMKRPSIFCNLLMALTFLSAGEWTNPSRYLIKYLHIAASWHPFIHCVSAAGISYFWTIRASIRWCTYNAFEFDLNHSNLGFNLIINISIPYLYHVNFHTEMSTPNHLKSNPFDLFHFCAL